MHGCHDMKAQADCQLNSSAPAGARRPGMRAGRLMRLAVTILGLALIAGFATGCAKRKAPRPRPSGPAPPATYRPYTIKGKTYRPMHDARGYVETGRASWYGPDFHGRRTASGEVYNMEAMTAAHKTLPINTWVQVTNLENGREARVRVNDRGPFVDGRVIDLSRAAARKLGVIGPGTARVRVRALGFARAGSFVSGRPTRFTRPASYRTGVFTVQVGAFTNPRNARRLAAKLRPQWGKVAVLRYDRGDKVFHRVRVGKLKTLDQAKRMQARLRQAGFSRAFAVAW